MKLSTAWIQEWLCRTISDDDIVQALEQAGIEIEQYNSSVSLDENLVVGLIKKVAQHPQADRLHLAEVEVGGELLHIVCGAPNVAEGQHVVVAQIGTTLPNGDTITKAKLRGEVSEGMLCSERELGLGTNHEGIMVLSQEVSVGTRLCDLYPADAVVDVKTPANRGDLLSVIGLAREVSALSEIELNPPPSLSAPKARQFEGLGEIEAQRYMLAHISLKPGFPSPAHISSRLRSSGMRSISGLVDVTNYVMLETGQPVHAFDAAKVKLPISVRHAHKGEKLVTLDKVERTLSPADLVIADATGPIALAGVMGGLATEASDTTTEILLELSTFDATTVRKTAQRHGLRSEASARFERRLPVKLLPVALNRAMELFVELTDAKLLGLCDTGDTTVETGAIELEIARLNSLLGISLTSEEAVSALGRLQITAIDHKAILRVDEAPWWRPDITLPEDLVEEIVRVIGYDRIPATLPLWQPRQIEFDRQRAKQRLLREVLYGAGLFEVLTYSFVSEEQLSELGLVVDEYLKLRNPLSSEQGYLRSSLLPSHIAVLERNRMYAKELGFYEISKVFISNGEHEQPHEPLHLAVSLVRTADAFSQAKGLLEAIAAAFGTSLRVDPVASAGLAPTRSATVILNGESAGVIGQIDPIILENHKIAGEGAYIEINVGILFGLAKAKRYQGIQRFPTIRRDIAVVLGEAVTWADVLGAIEPKPGTEVEYISQYRGDTLPAGKKSLTLRLILSLPERTPTEAEANDLEARVVSRLSHKLGASSRD